MSRKAIVALILGLLSLVLLGVTGLPALLVGFWALREVNQSDGRLAGRRLAVTGMALGALSMAVVIAWFAAALISHLQDVNNRAACQNNLRALGLAVNLYHNEHQFFPAATLPNEALTPEQRLSWLAAILPHLENEPGRRGVEPNHVYSMLQLDFAWDAQLNLAAVNTPLRWFICRSDPGASIDHRPALTSYVGIAGVGADAPLLPADTARAGVLGYDRRLTRPMLPAGLSQTMLSTEIALENGPWAAGGPPTLRALIPTDQPYIGAGRPFGGCHPGGLNVLFLDGRVDFVKETIPGNKFEALATIGID